MVLTSQGARVASYTEAQPSSNARCTVFFGSWPYEARYARRVCGLYWASTYQLACCHGIIAQNGHCEHMSAHVRISGDWTDLHISQSSYTRTRFTFKSFIILAHSIVEWCVDFMWMIHDFGQISPFGDFGNFIIIWCNLVTSDCFEPTQQSTDDAMCWFLGCYDLL